MQFAKKLSLLCSNPGTWHASCVQIQELGMPPVFKSRNLAWLLCSHPGTWHGSCVHIQELGMAPVFTSRNLACLLCSNPGTWQKQTLPISRVRPLTQHVGAVAWSVATLQQSEFACHWARIIWGCSGKRKIDLYRTGDQPPRHPR